MICSTGLFVLIKLLSSYNTIQSVYAQNDSLIEQFYAVNSGNNLCAMEVLLRQFSIKCFRMSVMFLVEGDVSSVVNTSGDVISVVCGVYYTSGDVISVVCGV